MQKDQSFNLHIPFKQKIVLILFGLFLFILALEAGLRIGGFILLSMQEYRNLQSIKQKGAYRVLCLGESTTGGQYPRFLEEILNQRDIGVHFSVIDKGAPGTNTSTILGKVESYLDEYHPDMVIAMMGINDWGELTFFEIDTTSRGMAIIRSFRIYKLTRLLWLHILTKTKEIWFHKTSEDGGRFEEVQNYLSEVWLKEVYAEPILTEGSFKKAVEINPKNDNAYVELGGVYRDQGKLSLAEDAFKKAIEINPKNDNAYFEFGWICLRQGKLSLAEDAFKKAIEINPKNDNAYTELGWIHREPGKLSLAEDAFKKATELNSHNDNAYFGLGWIYWDQGKLSLAEDAFKKAIEINPKNDNAYVELGRFYQNQGKFHQAERYFKKAIEINPRDDKIYGAMSMLYREMGSSKLAKEYTKKANVLRQEYYHSATVSGYRRLKEILDKRKIRLVCVQYPMRQVESLKKMFEDNEGIVFVDNEGIFKKVLEKASYKDYFRDSFGGDFGHCTDKGNQLLAENIAKTILKEVFNKQ